MTAVKLIQTAVLLAAFVLLAGCYGLFYGLGHLRKSPRLVAAGFLSYTLQTMVALAILTFTPLVLGWKVFIGLSSLVYLGIPPVTWRYLQSTHESLEPPS